MIRKIMLALLGVLVIIQFFHPDKNVRDPETQQDSNIEKVLSVPSEVSSILQNNCYDCHSNDTEYPWYAEIQPIHWWINHHIEEGKHELNFDEFANYSIRRQYKKLEEINEEVKDGEMPLKAYTLIHKDAQLNAAQKQTIANWVSAAQEYMRSIHPADSLLKKN